MALRTTLTEPMWVRIQTFLEVTRGRGRPGEDDRKFIEAILWWRRTGVPWRDLPEDFGPWKTVFNRFDNWSKKGKWGKLFEFLKTDINDEWHGVDDEWHSLDSTIN